MIDLEKNPAEFERTKMEAEKIYRDIVKIKCPFLDNYVNFNTKGLDHLKFKRWDHARPIKDQYVRLKLIHLAPEVLKSSHTLQGILKTKSLERQKINSRWEQRAVEVIYYEFISVIKSARVRVVVKKIQGGEAFFWSLVPYWKQTDYGKKLLHEGDPETD